MVRAILDGRKTLTRRILKPQPYYCHGEWHAIPRKYEHCLLADFVGGRIGTMPYIVGDRLWVRETWQAGSTGDGPQISYRATPDYFEIDAWDGPDEGAGPSFNYDRCPGAEFDHWLGDVLNNDGPWRSPIHMPRWASRITLEVTDVRVERLCEISHDDAVAEGVGIYPHSMSAQKPFREVWEGIHGPGSWEANPWVAAVSFCRLNG